MISPSLPPLIQAQALREALAASATQDWLVVDCRFALADPAAGRAQYTAGHVPGAVYAHLDDDLSGPKSGRNGRHPLPEPTVWQTTLRRWGVEPHTRVVAYDDAGGPFAARLWWLLHWAGHTQVQVLDGGWSAWLQAGGAVEAQAPAPRPGSALRVTPDATLVLDTDDVRALLPDLGPAGGQMLLDARSPDRFRGENETLDPVGGHIPGATNRFFQLNLAVGRFKPAAQLRAEFEALLAGRPAEAIVHQCGSGVTACHNLLAMAHAGWPLTRLYAGSWSAWCADPGCPVAR
ncbi:MAG: sulfurtransferase [Parazoarcus communis]